MDNNFHNQIERQITGEIIKGALYNQRMSELNSNQPVVHVSSSVNHYYEPLRTKKYKSQTILYITLNIIGIALVIIIALLFM